MDPFEVIYARALRFLSYRQRSEKEVRDYLLNKPPKPKRTASDPQIVDRLIVKLKEQRFLNDEELARMWVESRNRFRPRSQRLLKLELKRKGISDEIIESTLSADKQGINKLESNKETDLSLAKQIVAKKIKKVKHLPRQKIYQKLGGLLARRGFDWETIKRSIDENLKEMYNSS